LIGLGNRLINHHRRADNQHPFFLAELLLNMPSVAEQDRSFAKPTICKNGKPLPPNCEFCDIALVVKQERFRRVTARLRPLDFQPDAGRVLIRERRHAATDRPRGKLFNRQILAVGIDATWI
jgi:hypothetical protein